eukprot:TRINITY_DN2483_c0_g1_i1.p1 TRINITY_DN2483_c0_g1~~TRINITY_DN2483_c0_g1_i1.p1  ORF type:complete len:255 (+),score=26.29 TRINITY_DN2483_c0_g1_i1:192-956(+)
MQISLVLLLCALTFNLVVGGGDKTGQATPYTSKSKRSAKRASKTGSKTFLKQPQKQKGKRTRPEKGYEQPVQDPFKVIVVDSKKSSTGKSGPVLSAAPMAVEQLQEPPEIFEVYKGKYPPSQLDWMKKAEEYRKTQLDGKLQDFKKHVEDSIVYVLHCGDESIKDIYKMVSCKIGSTERSIKERLNRIVANRRRNVVVERKIITPFRQSFEQGLHAALSGYSESKRIMEVETRKGGGKVQETINGGTEWYLVSL